MVPFEDTFSDEYEEIYDGRPIKGFRREQKRARHNSKNPAQQRIEQPQVLMKVNEDLGGDEFFSFTYQASRYEAGWLFESLKSFHENHWIKDVSRLVKSGKEASVYLCQAGDALDKPYLAAKVYRPRQFRNLKNDHVYRENRDYLNENGHIIHDTRMVHAISKKTGFGQQLSHQSWIEHEVQAINAVREAGADVPEVYASGKNAILMTYFGDRLNPAPPLNEINLPLDLAKKLFDRVVFNIEIMLQKKTIHADLSAYNILFWEDEIMLIDFPQVINPHQNSHAWSIFQRDVTRVCQYFQRQGVEVDAFDLAKLLWKRNLHQVDFADFPELEVLDEISISGQNAASNALELGL